jgi:hypothetical protein
MIQKWTNEELSESVKEFYDLYQQRPIKDNRGGMKSPHMFPAWFIVKKLKPKILIESGVWKGLGTWFFEKASPETQIISIDPEPKFRVYTSPKVTYSTIDFLLTDWSEIPKAESLVFFDDHQDCFKRLKRCKELGFNKLIFEDNYPCQQGDCYTPKKILSNKDFVIDSNGRREWFHKNDDDLNFFKDNVTTYQEMPPLFKPETTRWGDQWSQENYPTPEPILKWSHPFAYPEFIQESKDYTWICYVELI